jgi:hypothetical protein
MAREIGSRRRKQGTCPQIRRLLTEVEVKVSSMRQLDADIARIEMRAEQMLLHLRSAPTSALADQLRDELFDMLKSLVALKTRREELEQDVLAA